MPEVDEKEEVLTPVEENKLRVAGFVPASWWHPVKHIIVEDSYRTSPRFTMIPGPDVPGTDYGERLTLDEVLARTVDAPDAPEE